MTKKPTFDLAVPLPNEIPSQIDLSQVAPSIRQSAVVESLIQQNLDLTSRLTVNLRRAADLEEVTQALTETVLRFDAQKEIFNEEVTVLRSRISSLEAKLSEIQIEADSSGRAYASILIEYQDLKSTLEKEKRELKIRVRRFERYRARIRNLLIPAAKRLKVQVQDMNRIQIENRRLTKYKRFIRTFIRPWSRELSSKIKFYRDRCEKLEFRNKDLSDQIVEVSSTLRSKTSEIEFDQRKLIDYHEKRFTKISTELDQYKFDFEVLREKFQEVDRQGEEYLEKNVKLENRAIVAERKLDQLQMEWKVELEKLSAEKSQLETLWNQSRLSQETSLTQSDAASRLNKKLSAELNLLRRENEQLRLRIREKSVAPKESNSVVPQAEPPKFSESSVNRMENLFAEIQSGHSRRTDGFSQDLVSERGDLGEIL